MKPPRFHYERPESLGAALQLLEAERERAKVLAGGQSLVALMNLRLASPEILVDIGRLDDLRFVRRTPDALEIGALTTHATIESDREIATACPLLAQAIGYIGHPAIRTRGTVGGSVAHADPAAELPVVLTALGGDVTVASRGETRRIAARDFFHGFLSTDVGSDEILTMVSLPAAASASAFAFEEFARRPGDFALVAVACAVRRDGDSVASVRVALGGVGQVPLLLDGLRDLHDASEADVLTAVREAIATISPRSDIHGTAEYRRHLIRTLTERALERALRGGRS